MIPETLDTTNPETLYALADTVGGIRLAVADPIGLDCIAEQFVMAARGSLTIAIAQLNLAAMHQARALAGNR